MRTIYSNSVTQPKGTSQIFKIVIIVGFLPIYSTPHSLENSKLRLVLPRLRLGGASATFAVALPNKAVVL